MVVEAILRIVSRWLGRQDGSTSRRSNGLRENNGMLERKRRGEGWAISPILIAISILALSDHKTNINRVFRFNFNFNKWIHDTYLYIILDLNMFFLSILCTFLSSQLQSVFWEGQAE